MQYDRTTHACQKTSIIDHRAFDRAQSCKLQTAVPKVLDYFNAMASEIAVIGDGLSSRDQIWETYLSNIYFDLT